MSTQSTKHIFHIHGMHCKACVLITENELNDLPHITHAHANLTNHSLEVVGDFGQKNPEQIAEHLSEVLKQYKYTVSTQKQKTALKWKDFKIAIPLALVFAFFFVLLQKLGIINLIQADTVTYGTAFSIGIVASLSSCMAVVGGLLLSMSATFAKEGERVRPQLMFHAGRIVSFFILGGVIGAVGSVFTLNTSITVGLSILIGLVMLILGINLLDVFPWAKKLQPSMPKFISKHALGVSKFNHTVTPLLVGVATFFLPCGFTQSMQLYTLTTGSFLEGGLTMLAFAIGTLPVLALVSFGSFKIKEGAHSRIFFKTAGLIVIMFALFNLINGLVVLGVFPPLFNF